MYIASDSRDLPFSELREACASVSLPVDGSFPWIKLCASHETVEQSCFPSLVDWEGCFRMALPGSLSGRNMRGAARLSPSIDQTETQMINWTT